MVITKKGKNEMEFLVVTDTKLKIILSVSDMKKYGIDGADINYDEPKVRRSFWRILDEAKSAVGFDVAGDKVLIQFYPSKDGSEIFVTKLGLLPQGAERAISRSGRVAMLSCKPVVYKFENLENLLGAVRLMENCGAEYSSRAFCDSGGEYYIITEQRRTVCENTGEFSPISEYGKEVPATLAPYIKEHSSELDFEILKKL